MREKNRWDRKKEWVGKRSGLGGRLIEENKVREKGSYDNERWTWLLLGVIKLLDREGGWEYSRPKVKSGW